MLKRIMVFTLALALSACASQTQTVNTKVQQTVAKTAATLNQDLTGIVNTLVPDLATALSVAQTVVPSTGKPADADGAACLTAITAVKTDVSAILNAANVSTQGVVTLLEVDSIFQPGGTFDSNEQQTLVSGCAAKANDVLGAAASLLGPAAVVNNLSALAPVIAPAVSAAASSI